LAYVARVIPLVAAAAVVVSAVDIVVAVVVVEVVESDSTINTIIIQKCEGFSKLGSLSIVSCIIPFKSRIDRELYRVTR